MKRLLGTLVALCAVAVAIVTAANISGAIFTTTSNGTAVNANIYANKADVYLNGGPQNQNSNGLPNGNYYFQVTDPSGAVLLSTDNIKCRVVAVVNERIAGVPANNAGGYGDPTCYHLNGTFNAGNGTTPVQLLPYNDTPNPGGEYKVWITLVADYDSTPNDLTGCASERGSHNSYGFCDSYSKTDNFKIRAPDDASVTVCKFNDYDGDGTQDAGEPLIPHWPIDATGVFGGPKHTQTDDDGCVTFIVKNFTNPVTFTEGTFGPDWEQTAPGDGSYGGGTFTVSGGVISIPAGKLKAGDDVTAPYFGNHNESCEADCNLNDLVVTKTAYPSLKRTYEWDITKSVDKTEVKQSDTSYTFNYTVEVTHDAGTDSDWQVTGKIRVSNPSGSPVTNVTVTDAMNIGGTCNVTDGDNATIPAGDHVDFSYDCSFGSAPTTGTNTGTATASFGAFTGSANFDFSTAAVNEVDEKISISDDKYGILGTVDLNDDDHVNPTSFNYPLVITGTAGTCVTPKNTATFTTNDTETSDSGSQTVKLCVGADLEVSKTASPSFTRTYNWSITKDVDRTKVEQADGTIKFNYTVTASETGFTDSAWRVGGTITVSNPNDWEDITADVTDAIDNGGTCIVLGGTGVTVPKESSVTVGYRCTYASAPNPDAFTNTGTATWDADAFATPNGSAEGKAAGKFEGPTKTTNKTITVTDTFDGTLTTLGTLTATDAPTYTTKTYTYAQTVNNAAGGLCKTYNNKAEITETKQSDSESVTVCNTDTGGLTIGFWQNKNGQAIITGGAAISTVCKSGTWLRQFAPFQDLSATATCTNVATYVTNIIKAANASGVTMNAMLKAQMLATALDVYFSDSALGTNKIGADNPIGAVKIDLTKVNKPIGSSTYENASGGFGGATSLYVLDLLAYAASQSNAGGSTWYALYTPVKATQELAKDTFDAINNKVAWIAP